MTGGPAQRWRIGVLATRVGVSETLLRAWEVRYGLLSPQRTQAGYRLYGPEDERRAIAMQRARERGVPAGQAAAEILANERTWAEAQEEPVEGTASSSGSLDVVGALSELEAAMLAYDVGAMHEVLDRLLRTVSVESAIRDVLLPFMAHVGQGWEAGDFDVADEHFASDLVRGRLAALAVGPGTRTGPTVLLACPPEESHDIALKAFEVVLQRAGWRTRFLGPNSPLASIRAAVDVIDPDVVVLAGATPQVFALDDTELAVVRRLAQQCALGLAGAGASAELAESWGALHLAGDPVTAATGLVERARTLLTPTD
jgi:MerR family transcriptional regulator, light-induced transcriptional regulator